MADSTSATPNPEIPDDDAGIPGVEIPPESKMLKAAYKASGLTAADLAAATGLSTASIHVAQNGVRYRGGKPKATVPPDNTLVKLASVLGISAGTLRVHGRDRAADLLAEVEASGDSLIFDSDREAQAVVHGRSVLAKQILAVFSTEELEDEAQRRRWEDQMEYQG